MNKNCVFSVLLVCMLALGLIVAGCSNTTGGGGSSDVTLNFTNNSGHTIPTAEIYLPPGVLESTIPLNVVNGAAGTVSYRMSGGRSLVFVDDSGSQYSAADGSRWGSGKTYNVEIRSDGHYYQQ